jgi:hypothetical protein
MVDVTPLDATLRAHVFDEMNWKMITDARSPKT